MNNIAEEKMSSYSDAKTNNFVVENELTVTITLNEYRKLVESNATKKNDIDKANNDKYNREQTIQQVEAENRKLKEEMHDLRKTIDSLQDQQTIQPVRDERSEE